MEQSNGEQHLWFDSYSVVYYSRILSTDARWLFPMLPLRPFLPHHPIKPPPHRIPLNQIRHHPSAPHQRQHRHPMPLQPLHGEQTRLHYMRPGHNRKHKRLCLVKQLRQWRNRTQSNRFVEQRPRQEVTAPRERHQCSCKHEKEEDLNSLWPTILFDGDVGPAQSRKTFLVHGYQTGSRLGETSHCWIDGDSVACAIGADD